MEHCHRLVQDTSYRNRAATVRRRRVHQPARPAPSINKGKARVGELVPDLSDSAIRKRVFEGHAEQDKPDIDKLPVAWLYSTAWTSDTVPPDGEPRRQPVSCLGLGMGGGTLPVSMHPPVGEMHTLQSDDFSLSSTTRSGSGNGTSRSFPRQGTAGRPSVRLD